MKRDAPVIKHEGSEAGVHIDEDGLKHYLVAAGTKIRLMGTGVTAEVQEVGNSSHSNSASRTRFFSRHASTARRSSSRNSFTPLTA